jgi:hypothetical protein
VSEGSENKATPEGAGRPGVRALRRTVDPVIPRQVASPQSLTPLHRILANPATNKANAVGTFRGEKPKSVCLLTAGSQVRVLRGELFYFPELRDTHGLTHHAGQRVLPAFVV